MTNPYQATEATTTASQWRPIVGAVALILFAIISVAAIFLIVFFSPETMEVYLEFGNELPAATQFALSMTSGIKGAVVLVMHLLGVAALYAASVFMTRTRKEAIFCVSIVTITQIAYLLASYLVISWPLFTIVRDLNS